MGLGQKETKKSFVRVGFAKIRKKTYFRVVEEGRVVAFPQGSPPDVCRSVQYFILLESYFEFVFSTFFFHFLYFFFAFIYEKHNLSSAKSHFYSYDSGWIIALIGFFTKSYHRNST
jgi:hypothetical protein